MSDCISLFLTRVPLDLFGITGGRQRKEDLTHCLSYSEVNLRCVALALYIHTFASLKRDPDVIQSGYKIFVQQIIAGKQPALGDYNEVMANLMRGLMSLRSESDSRTLEVS